MRRTGTSLSSAYSPCFVTVCNRSGPFRFFRFRYWLAAGVPGFVLMRLGTIFRIAAVLVARVAASRVAIVWVIVVWPVHVRVVRAVVGRV
jgi:hypothetical protein